MFALKIIFEIGLIFLIALGFKYEDKLIDMEERMGAWLDELYVVLRQYVRRKLGVRK